MPSLCDSKPNSPSRPKSGPTPSRGTKSVFLVLGSSVFLLHALNGWGGGSSVSLVSNAVAPNDSCNPRRFIEYQSSDWEKYWISNIRNIQKGGRICEEIFSQKEQTRIFMNSTCSAFTNTPWCLLDDSVHKLWYNLDTGETREKKPSDVWTVSPVRIPFPDNPAVFSWFKYANDCVGETFKEYIEPLVSHLRHPLVCGSLRKLYLTDRSYIVPPNPHGKRNFYFDCGASIWNEGAGGPSLSYFTTVWKRSNIEFDEIYAFEGTTPEAKFYMTVPDDYRNRTLYKQTYVDENFPFFIKNIAEKEDYVLFKLDIDNGKLETSIVDTLVQSDATDYVDEFLWEHHVKNYVMASSWRKTIDRKSDIQDSYQRFLQLRRLGIRAHSWV